MSVGSCTYKSKIQKNGIDREIQGLEILSVKMALKTMGVHELAPRDRGMRRQKGKERMELFFFSQV